MNCNYHQNVIFISHTTIRLKLVWTYIADYIFNHIFTCDVSKIGLTIGILLTLFPNSLAQTDRSTKNNYTGNWNTPTSWEPNWNTPRTKNINFNISVNGYISCYERLQFSTGIDTLFVHDTLVIHGDLDLGTRSSLVIKPRGILFIMGNLISNNMASINTETDAYLVITGDFTKKGDTAFGGFSSDNSPSKVFIGGTVEGRIDTVSYPVLNCSGTDIYNSSNCAYGNMQDIVNDSIYSFFQSTCSDTMPIIHPSDSINICDGDTIVLSTNDALQYQWSTGATTQSITVSSSGDYTVSATYSEGCPLIASAPTTITNHPLPVAEILLSETSGIKNNDGNICEGDMANLSASGGISYRWSTGDTISEITTSIAGLYTVTVTDEYGCSETANATVDVTPKPIVDAGSNSNICGMNHTLDAISNMAGSWIITSGPGTVSFNPGHNEPNATIEISEFGRYEFKWQAMNEGCTNSDSVVINFHEPPRANAGDNQQLTDVQSTQMQAELLPDETGEWIRISGTGNITNKQSASTSVSGLQTGENIFAWIVSNQFCTASDTVIIEVNNLFIPQVITPNGDGKNDLFVIPDIELNGPVEIAILNRWGNIVYENTDYANNWNGTSKGEAELANDTYFYVLRFNNGQTKKGFVIIKK